MSLSFLSLDWNLYKLFKPFYEDLLKNETIPIEQRQRSVEELGKVIVQGMEDAEKELAAVTARCERDVAEAQAKAARDIAEAQTALYYSKLARADISALGELK